MNSYIPSNKIEMLTNNILLVNDKYFVNGIFMHDDDEIIYTFKPFSGLPVDEEKDCVNDIAVYLNGKLKKLNNKIYATHSHFDHDRKYWYINFTTMLEKQNNFHLYNRDGYVLDCKL